MALRKGQALGVGVTLFPMIPSMLYGTLDAASNIVT